VTTSSSDLDLLTMQRRWTDVLDAPAGDHERFLGVRLVGSAADRRWRRLPGSTLPPDVLSRIESWLGDPPESSLSTELIEAVRVAVVDGRPPSVGGGPVYLAGPEIDRLPCPAGAAVVTSEHTHGASHLPAPDSWEEGEWSDLLTGRSGGPWAAVVVDDVVASLTHTPKPLLEGAAECGAWTDPRFRGQGLARIATAAWIDLVATNRRRVFYSTEQENLASQAVATRLGLRHLGWQWTISAEPLPTGDAWGRALLDHLRGRWTPTPQLETNDGQLGPAMHPEWFFRAFDEWDWWERELLPPIACGPALDLGAGAGRVSLWLQQRGIEVTAVDSSPGAVEVCRARGVADARLGDLNDPPTDKPWRSIYLACGNLGLGGSRDCNRRLLCRLAEISAPDAILYGDTVEPGRVPDIRLRIRYKGEATPWWTQRNVPVDEVAELVDGTGWTLERHVVDLPDHAVVLRRGHS
jgi:RimJ/RimL family protein N-acetyltransferase